MNPEEPSHPAPFDVGDTVAVHGLLAFSNSSGGTGTMQLTKAAPMLCRVTKSLWDYETGWRYHAEPVADEDIERVRRAGTTQFNPDWYRANRPDDAAALARSIEAEAAFNPSKVFVSEHDATLTEKAEPTAGPARRR